MSYVDKQLLSGEKILFKTSKHWIVFLPTIVWLALSIFAYQLHIFHHAEVIPFSITLVMFVVNGIDYFFSEYAITNQRVLMKEGFVWRKSIETVLSSISRSELNQTILGRVLGFGQINIFGFGGSNAYANLNHSAAFQRCLQQRLGLL